MDVSRPWSDLPQGIIELIVNKLHFADQVRALAVCKKWRRCKDNVRCSDTLPWVMCYERNSDVESARRPFMCDLVDPYSRKTHKVSNSLDMDPNCSVVRPFASKKGCSWVNISDSDLSFFFLHNPFTNEIRYVSSMPFGYDDDMTATIKGSPTSPECEIFTLGFSGGELHIYTNKPNGITSEFIAKLPKREILYSVIYMKGNVYCLFWNGMLKSYNLEDKSWKYLTSGFPTPYQLWRGVEDCWLIEMSENVIMVRLDGEGECVIFRFDWSLMSWVVETGLQNCAIYISGNVAFSRPLSNSQKEYLESCKVFYLEREFKCYSLNKEAVWSEIQPEEYDWISSPQGCNLSFIEPPYFGI